MKLRGVERSTRTIDKTADAVLFGLWRMVCKTIEPLEPKWMLLRAIKVEATGIENALQRCIGETGLDDIGHRIQGPDNHSGGIALSRRSSVDLVEHNHIGKFDLLDQ